MTLTLRAKFGTPATPGAPTEKSPAVTLAASPRVGIADPTATPAAKNLAMAYYLAKVIEQGLLPDYAAAARLLGVSQPRLTHLMGLLLLAPQIQESILLGTVRLGDKQLRKLARIAGWAEQLAALSAA